MTFVRSGCGTCELTGAARLRVRFGLVERLCANKDAAPTLGVAGISPALGRAGCWALRRGRAINAIPKQKRIVRSLSVIIVITYIIAYLANNKPVSVSIFLPLRLEKDRQPSFRAERDVFFRAGSRWNWRKKEATIGGASFLRMRRIHHFGPG
jgi:hypothetical protein